MERAAALPFDVIVISDDAPELVARAERMFRDVPTGRVALQLRRPDLGAGALYSLARALRALTHERGVSLFVNDRVDVALAVGADGVQLPERGLTAESALAALPHGLVGVSRHDLAGVRGAGAASFAIVSPIHAVPAKGPPLGFAGLAAVCAASSVPVYALGGLGLSDVSAVRACGARGVALIRALWSAPDPRAALAALLAAFDSDVAPSGVRG